MWFYFGKRVFGHSFNLRWGYLGPNLGRNPIWLVFSQEEQKAIWTQRRTGRRSCDDRGREWHDAAAGWGMSKVNGHHQKLGRGSIGFDPEAQREHDTIDTSSSDMSPLELWQNEFPSFFSQPVCDTLLSQTPRELILKVSKISEENTHLDIGPSMVTPSDNRPICCVSLNLFLLYKICQEVLLVYNHKMFELKQTHWSLSWLFCFSYEGIFVLRKAVTAQGSRIRIGKDSISSFSHACAPAFIRLLLWLF